MQCGSLDWILERKKDISGKAGEIEQSGAWRTRLSSVGFLVLTNVPPLCSTLTKGDAREGCKEMPHIIFATFLYI